LVLAIEVFVAIESITPCHKVRESLLAEHVSVRGLLLLRAALPQLPELVLVEEARRVVVLVYRREPTALLLLLLLVFFLRLLHLNVLLLLESLVFVSLLPSQLLLYPPLYPSLQG
jgi:hypothetical protein